jgi:hypothetical protein
MIPYELDDMDLDNSELPDISIVTSLIAQRLFVDV